VTRGGQRVIVILLQYNGRFTASHCICKINYSFINPKVCPFKLPLLIRASKDPQSFFKVWGPRINKWGKGEITFLLSPDPQMKLWAV
jgi:hypothetical protein